MEMEMETETKNTNKNVGKKEVVEYKKCNHEYIKYSPSTTPYFKCKKCNHVKM
jgi:hypothetical protein